MRHTAKLAVFLGVVCILAAPACGDDDVGETDAGILDKGPSPKEDGQVTSDSTPDTKSGSDLNLTDTKPGPDATSTPDKGVTCGLVSCALGCCSNNVCEPGTSDTACGLFGQACQTCTAVSTKCSSLSRTCVPAKSKPCKDVVGKACKKGNFDCGTNNLCLVTHPNGIDGVCSCTCTPDNPSTSTVNEDTCPSLSQHGCGTVPAPGGKTQDVCLKYCSPKLGANDCPGKQACHPASGVYAKLPGKPVCLHPGCEKNADCPVITKTTCDTALKNCPTGQTCRALSTTGTAGRCAVPGICDTKSRLCAPRSANFKATAKVGDPCKADTDCAANMRCELERTGGTWVHARNGYCHTQIGCNFGSTLKQFACPTGSLCNKRYPGGICFKSCLLKVASTCRGHSADKYGDYECRDWNIKKYKILATTTGPICEWGDAVPCGLYPMLLQCPQWGTTGNTTSMECRLPSGAATTQPSDPAGLCLDKTVSGP
jgi:hypothetical protein